MADVKLFRPQRLTDNPDGGGLATATEIVDGQVNNLFDDISRIDRVNGELSLRKAFAQAATADTELYSDLHVIVQAPPADPRVAAVLFRTNSWSDERDDAKAQVERYLDESVISRMIPYDRQLQGQRTVLVYQRPELSLPEVGEVYALKVDATNVVEFIRVSDMDHQVETFTDADGDYRVRVITLTISQPLSVEFSGSQPNRFFTVDVGKSVVRKTIASDAARYKGVVALAQDANIGDLTIKVDSVFAQLVPAATSEVAVVDAGPAGGASEIAAASAPVTMDLEQLSTSVNAPVARILPTAITPATLSVQRDGAPWQRFDDGKGNIIDELANGAVVGSVDYASGRLSLFFGSGTFHQFSANTLMATYMPAASSSKVSLSHQIPVEIQNRGYVYVTTLRPPPAPGSTVVSFRALGKWYTLEDDGSGALVGDSGVGSGLVNFQTGSVQLTLGALPDISSSVIYAWGGSSEYEIRDGDINIKVPSVELALDAGNCEPGSLSITWQAGGITKTAADDGAGGLTGDAIGEVLYATGAVLLRPTVLPDSNAEFTADYDAASTTTETFNPILSGGTVTLALGDLPRQGSLRIEYTGQWPSPFGTATAASVLRDNGAGQLVDAQGVVVVGSSVNYATGQVTFNPDFIVQGTQLVRSTFSNVVPSNTYSNVNGRYFARLLQGEWATSTSNTSIVVHYTSGAAMLVSYKAASAVDLAWQDVVPAPPLVVDLVPRVSNAIVPGGLLFAFGGRTYYDRQGVLYYGMNAATGAGTAAGAVDYAAGKVTISSWAGNSPPAFDVLALLTEVGVLPMEVVHGRTPGSPLRPGTFSLQANRYADGTLVLGTSDNNGNIDTADMHGYVDVTTGVFSVGFGAYVLDAGLSSDEKLESWYDASNVDPGGYIWRPRGVIPGTIRFNAVVQTSLPQDPEIIKVNPVRLPMDGRVQAIRAGDTLVIHDTQAQTLAAPLVGDQVVSLARSGVQSIALYDQLGLGVDPAHYTFDRLAGTVTFDAPLDLGAYAQPLVLLHTVEDMALCLDAQITGEVSLGHALTHGYTAGQSLVSSALILGDAQARYQSLFAQATWTNVWSNSVIGDAPSSGAQYNDATYPVEVLNRDAITQRWRLAFTSATAYNIVGEEVGVIGTGTTSADAAPLNPATGLPYFRVMAAGFGAGWGTGNTIRFNTVAAGGPIWTARTVLSGPASNQDDLLRLQLRWDKD